MKTLLNRSAILSAGLCLLIPGALWAHQGHAGEHGWLAGALQPLLSVQHFLAALFVVLVASVGLMCLGRWAAGLVAQPVQLSRPSASALTRTSGNIRAWF
jgi:hydrogenase/urease accessory protein HupE